MTGCNKISARRGLHRGLPAGLALATLVLLLASQGAYAKQEWYSGPNYTWIPPGATSPGIVTQTFLKIYGSWPDKLRCAACHKHRQGQGKGDLNYYGMAFGKPKRVNAGPYIEYLDSGSDGLDNHIELNNGTLPGYWTKTPSRVRASDRKFADIVLVSWTPAYEPIDWGTVANTSSFVVLRATSPGGPKKVVGIVYPRRGSAQHRVYFRDTEVEAKTYYYWDFARSTRGESTSIGPASGRIVVRKPSDRKKNRSEKL